jgi:hypothetical protein
MHIFESEAQTPYVPDTDYFMAPKPLVEGSQDVLLSLKHRIMSYYDVSKDDVFRKDWEKWFMRHLPDNEDANEYMSYQKYKCPLLSYFKRSTFNEPIWTPGEPLTSFSIFPSNIVVALPSVQCRYDHHGTAKPYMVITTGNENSIEHSNSLLSRYSKIKDHEFTRLRNLGKVRLVDIVSRKHKFNGGRYGVTGTLDKLSSLVFDCNINFTALRLEPLKEESEILLVRAILDGGERVNMTSTSVATTIDDVNISVKEVMTLRRGSIMSTVIMDSILKLNAIRDNLVCSAYKVNEKNRAIYLVNHAHMCIQKWPISYFQSLQLM